MAFVLCFHEKIKTKRNHKGHRGARGSHAGLGIQFERSAGWEVFEVPQKRLKLAGIPSWKKNISEGFQMKVFMWDFEGKRWFFGV